MDEPIGEDHEKVLRCMSRVSEAVISWASFDNGGKHELGTTLLALETLASVHRRLAREHGVSKDAVKDLQKHASHLGRHIFDSTDAAEIIAKARARAQDTGPKDFTADDWSAAGAVAADALAAILQKK